MNQAGENLSQDLTEELFWEMEEDLDVLQRQLLFVLHLWHDKNENYERVAEAVRLSAHELRKKAERSRYKKIDRACSDE
jgi:hypothetical protein